MATEHYTFNYKTFEPGDFVGPTSKRCPLDPGRYKVVKFVKPLIPYETDGIVFVEGKKTGISAEYLAKVA